MEALRDDHILHVFCIDWDGTVSPKLSVVPLGIDFHSKLYKYRRGLPAHPRTQEAALKELVARSLSAEQYHRRQIKIFRDDMTHSRIRQWEGQSKGVIDRYHEFIDAANTSFDALYRWPHLIGHRLPDIVGAENEVIRSLEQQPASQQTLILRVLRRNIARWNALYRINETLIDSVTERKSEREIYEMRSDYVFVLSPFGGGMDCYRMWEALIFGHIVITQQSPLDALYEGLPVVVVKDWNEITSHKLDEWHRRYFFNGTAQNNAFVRRKLSTAFWIHRMKSLQSL